MREWWFGGFFFWQLRIFFREFCSMSRLYLKALEPRFSKLALFFEIKLQNWDAKWMGHSVYGCTLQDTKLTHLRRSARVNKLLLLLKISSSCCSSLMKFSFQGHAEFKKIIISVKGSILVKILATENDDLNLVNLKYISLVRWFICPSEPPSKRLMFQLLFCFHNFLKNSLQK